MVESQNSLNPIVCNWWNFQNFELNFECSETRWIKKTILVGRWIYLIDLLLSILTIVFHLEKVLAGRWIKKIFFWLVFMMWIGGSKYLRCVLDSNKWKKEKKREREREIHTLCNVLNLHQPLCIILLQPDCNFRFRKMHILDYQKYEFYLMIN